MTGRGQPEPLYERDRTSSAVDAPSATDAAPAPHTPHSDRSSTVSRVRAHVREWRIVYLAWALSRMLVLVVGFGAEIVARTQGLDPFRPFAHAATYVHYADVVINGYIFDGPGGAFDNATEYPLLPAIMWLGSQIGVPLAATAMIVANFCFLAGLILMAKVGERYVGVTAARYGAVYLAIAPFAYFFSIASTEALLLVLTAGSVLLALRATPGAWIGAGALAALAASSRPPGAFVGIVLLFIALSQLVDRRLSWKGVVAGLLAGAAIPAAVLGFFAFLKYETGDFFASLHAQEQFNREVTLDGPLRALESGARLAAGGSIGQAIELVATIGAAAALVWFLATAAGNRWEVRGWVLYGAVSLLLPLASGVLYSMPRLVLLILPAFWVLGAFGRQHRYLHYGIIALFPLALAVKVVTEVIGVS